MTWPGDDPVGQLAQPESGAVRSRIKTAPLKLRVHHLFALTAVMAALLAISGPREIQGFEIPATVKFIFSVLGVLYAILASVAITVVAYGVAWRCQGYLFFHEPGHWLLVTVSVEQLIHASFNLV